jgi:hypothetical protein
MTAVDGGPVTAYEAATQYWNNITLIDGLTARAIAGGTDELPGMFCKDCEHSPCIAGGLEFCSMFKPQTISRIALKRQVKDAIADLPHRDTSRGQLLTTAVAALGSCIFYDGHAGEKALEGLAALLKHTQELTAKRPAKRRSAKR